MHNSLAHDPTLSAYLNSVNAGITLLLLSSNNVLCTSKIDLWQQHSFDSYKLTQNLHKLQPPTTDYKNHH